MKHVAWRFTIKRVLSFPICTECFEPSTLAHFVWCDDEIMWVAIEIMRQHKCDALPHACFFIGRA